MGEPREVGPGARKEQGNAVLPPRGAGGRPSYVAPASHPSSGRRRAASCGATWRPGPRLPPRPGLTAPRLPRRSHSLCPAPFRGLGSASLPGSPGPAARSGVPAAPARPGPAAWTPPGRPAAASAGWGVKRADRSGAGPEGAASTAGGTPGPSASLPSSWGVPSSRARWHRRGSRGREEGDGWTVSGRLAQGQRARLSATCSSGPAARPASGCPG